MSLMSDLRRLRRARLGREVHRSVDRQGDSAADHKTASHQAPSSAHASEQQQPTPYHRRRRRRYETKKPDEVLADWTIAVAAFTGVLAFASIAGDAFSYRTLRAINGQLHEMQTGGAQTDQIIAADKALAEAAKAQATAANNLANITRQNIALSQRAWVGPNGAIINTPPVPNSEISMVVTYQNTGKEPARDAIVAAAPFVIKADSNGFASLANMDDRLRACRQLDAPNGAQVIYPSTGFSGNQITVKINKSDVDEEVVKGTKIVGVTGCIVYRSFDMPRHSAFCYFYKAGVTTLPNMSFCVTGGYAD